jgi:hypothetical protein
MRWFTGTLLWETPADASGAAGAAPAPGTEEGAAPPAGAINTETQPGGQQPPETIPYPRFKEVNDQLAELRDFRPLVEAGYTPDDLSTLASFGLAYDADPIGTWAKMAEGLDLPQELKDQLAAHVGTQGSQPEGEGNGQTPPETSSDPRLEALWQRDQERAAAEERDAQDKVLDGILGHWSEMDKRDGIEVPDTVKLTFVMPALGAGGNLSVQQYAESARQAYLSHRDEILQSAVRTGPSPRPVPGGGAAPTGAQKFGDLRAASRQAAEDIKAGRLPGIRP